MLQSVIVALSYYDLSLLCCHVTLCNCKVSQSFGFIESRCYKDILHTDIYIHVCMHTCNFVSEYLKFKVIICIIAFFESYFNQLTFRTMRTIIVDREENTIRHCILCC